MLQHLCMGISLPGKTVSGKGGDARMKAFDIKNFPFVIKGAIRGTNPFYKLVTNFPISYIIGNTEAYARHLQVYQKGFGCCVSC